MDWISVNDRVPDDRRRVLVWGKSHFGPIDRDAFLGASRYNRKRYGDGRFDCESVHAFIPVTVTHWAEIVSPHASREIDVSRLSSTSTLP